MPCAALRSYGITDIHPLQKKKICEREREREKVCEREWNVRMFLEKVTHTCNQRERKKEGERERDWDK